MQIKFWGTRGDIPAPEKDKLKFGGNTLCIEVIGDDPKIKIYIDAGIGLMLAGKQMDPEVNMYHIVLTHFHWDHVQGVLPFVPLFIPTNKIFFYGYASTEHELKEYLNTLYLYVFSPLRTIDFYASKIYYKPIQIGTKFELNGVEFESVQLEHGDFTLGYKVSNGNKSFLLASDHEVKENSYLQRKLVEAAKGVDLLIHDCKFNERDYKLNRNQGHSGILQALETAKSAGVKKLGLIHYHPSYSDGNIQAMIDYANDREPGIQTFGCREGMIIKFDKES